MGVLSTHTMVIQLPPRQNIPYQLCILSKWALQRCYTKSQRQLFLPPALSFSDDAGYFLIDGTQKISVKQEKQYNSKANTSNPCKPHGKTQLGFSLSAQGNEKAQPKTAKQSGRTHNNGYNPSQNAQQSIIPGAYTKATERHKRE
jgi:hypothetical protein